MRYIIKTAWEKQFRFHINTANMATGCPSPSPSRPRTVHDVALVVAVVVAVRGPVIDVKSLDGRVVVARGDVLQKNFKRLHERRKVLTESCCAVATEQLTLCKYEYF